LSKNICDFFVIRLPCNWNDWFVAVLPYFHLQILTPSICQLSKVFLLAVLHVLKSVKQLTRYNAPYYSMLSLHVYNWYNHHSLFFDNIIIVDTMTSHFCPFFS
jgi:hypothetical protein